MKVAKETERSLPGMEEEELPAGLERKLKLHHAAKCNKADADSKVKDTFAVVEEAMHEADITSCKIRISGRWLRFSLNQKETGKFEDVKGESDNGKADD